MKFLLILGLLVSANVANAKRSPSSTVPEDTIKRLAVLYPGQGESKIVERINNTNSAFEKWRAFPPYFYDLLRRSSDIVGKDFMSSRQGLCAGDAHLENFGFLYFDNPLFSINDLDDVSVCPLNADALRLFLGHRLVSNISADEWIKNYTSVGKKKEETLPQYLLGLKNESLRKRRDLSKKYLKLFDSNACSGDFSTVTDDERKILSDYLSTKEQRKLRLACSRTKESGGSAGLKRYILFYEAIEGGKNFPAAIELKPLSTPAPLAPVVLDLGARESLLSRGIEFFFGPVSKSLYFPVRLNEKSYLRRPLWGGNAGVSLEDMSSDDIKEVALYEARVLGAYHAKSNGEFSIKVADWGKISEAILKKWRLEMGE